MNEEAMTPDKEQVVEPRSAPHTSDEWRAFFRERGWVITMDDRPGQAFDAFVHIAADTRTASVAGLDRERLAAALMTVMNTDDAQQFVLAWGDPSDQTGTWDLALDMADAILAALNSAPSIEQEPGETLRAADLRRALRANRHAPDIARDPMANQWNRGIDRALEIVDRLALEADRNPQETER